MERSHPHIVRGIDVRAVFKEELGCLEAAIERGHMQWGSSQRILAVDVGAGVEKCFDFGEVALDRGLGNRWFSDRWCFAFDGGFDRLFDRSVACRKL